MASRPCGGAAERRAGGARPAAWVSSPRSSPGARVRNPLRPVRAGGGGLRGPGHQLLVRPHQLEGLMTAESTVAHEAAPPARPVPPSVRWLLLGLTLLLAALAAAQLVYFAPRCLWVMQRYGVRDPGYLRLVLHIPEWAPL